jgi:hypothetical protein
MIVSPPIFALADASSAVRGYLKAPGKALRFYLFGEADQLTVKPYAVWQTVGGSPENYINQRPDADDWSVQVDVYTDGPNNTGPEVARNVAKALIESFEGAAYVTSYNGEYREAETRLYRFSFSVDFITHRT